MAPLPGVPVMHPPLPQMGQPHGFGPAGAMVGSMLPSPGFPLPPRGGSMGSPHVRVQPGQSPLSFMFAGTPAARVEQMAREAELSQPPRGGSMGSPHVRIEPGPSPLSFMFAGTPAARVEQMAREGREAQLSHIFNAGNEIARSPIERLRSLLEGRNAAEVPLQHPNGVDSSFHNLLLALGSNGAGGRPQVVS